MANEGKRKKCFCIKDMILKVGRDNRTIFKKGEQYHCTIRDDHKTMISYKIYGSEFDLSCTAEEFLEYFILLKK